MDLQKCKEEYAELLVTGGICVKPGEKVIVNTDVSTWEMALLTAKKCYEHGASKVEIRWSCGQADALDYAYRGRDSHRELGQTGVSRGGEGTGEALERGARDPLHQRRRNQPGNLGEKMGSLLEPYECIESDEA